MGNGLCTHTKLTMPLKLMIIAKNVFTLKFCFLCFFSIFYTITKEKIKALNSWLFFLFWTKYSFSSKLLTCGTFYTIKSFKWKTRFKMKKMDIWRVQRMLRTKNDGKMVSVTDYFIILRLTQPLIPPQPQSTRSLRSRKRFKYFKIIKKK